MAADAVRVAGRYLLRERLGAGGMGEVWRAGDELLHRTVAVKLILPALVDEPGFVRRFLAEARAMASVQHPGVVAIHDFHADDNGAYLVMEYVEGESLSGLLARTGRLSAERAMDLVRQTALALQAAHDRGIVHRDVKPANLLVRPDGTVALTDFGIALGTSHTALTASGAVLGTPAYLAPEQVLGQAASPRSDVYALGIVAFECLTGRRPFTGDNPFAVAMQRVGQPPPALDPAVPPAVAAVVARAMQPDPSLRWGSAAEFAAAAAQAVGPVAPSGRARVGPVPRQSGDGAAGAGEAGARRRAGHRLGIAAAAVVLALVAGIAAWVAWPERTATPARAPATGPDAGARTTVPKGFVACADALCPAEPMCWRGLVQLGDKGNPPRSDGCAVPHYWETFAATYLPSDASTDTDLTTLMRRPDIAALCSAERMADRSRDPAATADWRREAWPIAADAYTILVHCLAGSGETPGAVFRSGV
jgi:serine/threonine-protein kinase